MVRINQFIYNSLEESHCVVLGTAVSVTHLFLCEEKKLNVNIIFPPSLPLDRLNHIFDLVFPDRSHVYKEIPVSRGNNMTITPDMRGGEMIREKNVV